MFSPLNVMKHYMCHNICHQLSASDEIFKMTWCPVPTFLCEAEKVWMNYVAFGRKVSNFVVQQLQIAPSLKTSQVTVWQFLDPTFLRNLLS